MGDYEAGNLRPESVLATFRAKRHNPTIMPAISIPCPPSLIPAPISKVKAKRSVVRQSKPMADTAVPLISADKLEEIASSQPKVSSSEFWADVEESIGRPLNLSWKETAK